MRAPVLALALTACGGAQMAGPIDAGPVDAGPLDQTFGTRGATLTAFPCGGGAYSNTVVQTATGFVAGGGACKGWAMVGYTPSGAIDPAFGDAGTVLLFTNDSTFNQIDRIVVRPDGRLVVGGNTNTRPYLRQFSASGKEDTAFSQNLEGDFAAHIQISAYFAVDANGATVIASNRNLLKRKPDGTRDPTFGTNGRMAYGFFNSRIITDLQLRPDGKILIIGADTSSGTDQIPFVGRLTASGAIDAAFGDFGSVKIPAPDGGSVLLLGSALQPDDRLVLSGYVYDPADQSTRAALWRITEAGALDSTFGTAGRALGKPAAGTSSFRDVEVLADGTLVAAGEYEAKNVYASWQVARFKADGTFEPSFGQGGTLAFDLLKPNNIGGATSVLVTDAGFVVGGRAHTLDNPDFEVPIFGVARIAR